MRAAVFIDRDGVLVAEGTDGVLPSADLRLLPGAARATGQLHDAGYLVVVVTNQPIVARGLITEGQLEQVHAKLSDDVRAAGGIVDAIEACPHHPEATDARYRLLCECRKPRAGLLLQAAQRLAIDLAASFMIGDRATDIEAGRKAGCRTVLVRSGSAGAPRIQTPEPPDPTPPDAIVDDLATAANLIVSMTE